jgi:Histidine kinase-, DNA gyrase B-, and HSP90-like ATPase
LDISQGEISGPSSCERWTEEERLMPRSHFLPPSAASLTASLRDLGYSLETAIADLIDNSISADATEIQIFCDVSRSVPVLVITDNGRGMLEDEVIAAMRHGSIDPRKKRGPKDMGRFGLGLKTASFSQCRQLTVVSAVSGKHAGAEWNLDEVEKKDDWFIILFDSDEIRSQPYFETLGDSGTLVIWRDLDRLFEDEIGRRRAEIVSEKLSLVERHLSLVFHRFLAGEVKGQQRKLTIRINGHPISPFDPFCRKNAATRMLPEEVVWVDDVAVSMQPYILPHHSRLSASEYDYYQNRSDFISNQGAYIYRNGRLMAWGDWFRLVPKGEATKLARVQVDFPNSLDEAWIIDIKKSRARPPLAVRERLRQIIAKIIASSVSVHRGRGQKLFQENEAPLWERYADRAAIRFEINTEHPLITSLHKKLSQEDACSLRVLLDSIAASLPIEMIYSDYSTHPREVRNVAVDSNLTLDRLNNLKQVLYGEALGDPNAFLQIVQSTHLFDDQIEMVNIFINETFV